VLSGPAIDSNEDEVETDTGCAAASDKMTFICVIFTRDIDMGCERQLYEQYATAPHQ
jgi:hypothetical protein